MRVPIHDVPINPNTLTHAHMHTVVVHSQHGIAKFVGFENIAMGSQGVMEKYFILQFEVGYMHVHAHKHNIRQYHYVK
jgi:hypothetical protein